MNSNLKTAQSKKLGALSEYYSKKKLSEYGIPVTIEELASNEGEVISAINKVGYPVAMKACSPRLLHKSESGSIELNIRTEEQALDAYKKIIASTDVELEGVLIQEMVPGMRELVLGLSRDTWFGACVMLGLGGVMTEILNDTAFRVAPFDMAEAEEMIYELKSRDIFKDFRGEKRADIETICRSLVALGRMGMEDPKIAEIDINPLKIDPLGKVKAVDALIVIEED